MPFDFAKEVKAMRFTTDQGETLATFALNPTDNSGTCRPVATAGDYRVEGPTVNASIQKDEGGEGLVISLALPDLLTFGLVIEKDDVKQLKGLMNKDAVTFMIKAFMK